MPELPEVETVRRGLEATVVGRRIIAVTITGRRSVRRQPPAELRARLAGRRIEDARRHGKYLALPLDDGQVLVIHLRMSGQLLYVPDPKAAPLLPHTHVIAHLGPAPGRGGRGAELWFVDPRTFGEWCVTDEVGTDGLPADFARFGPDPLIDGLSGTTLGTRLSGKRRPLKAALTDQRVVAGIGSLYADEICWSARLRPDHRCEALGPADYRRLASSTMRVLRSAIEARGSSLRDGRYRDLLGELGEYQRSHRVYDRAGTPCPRCRAVIERIAFGARVAYCCPSCQH